MDLPAHLWDRFTALVANSGQIETQLRIDARAAFAPSDSHHSMEFALPEAVS